MINMKLQVVQSFRFLDKIIISEIRIIIKLQQKKLQPLKF